MRLEDIRPVLHNSTVQALEEDPSGGSVPDRLAGAIFGHLVAPAAGRLHRARERMTGSPVRHIRIDVTAHHRNRETGEEMAGSLVMVRVVDPGPSTPVMVFAGQDPT